ncbi:MAG: hypothetical protein RIQ79_2118 [Verrucomicrobiota bacterium]
MKTGVFNREGTRSGAKTKQGMKREEIIRG